MSWIRDTVFKLILKKKSMQQAILSFIKEQESQLAGESLLSEGLSYDVVTVGAVQMQMELVRNGVHYAKKVFELTKKAIEQGSQLVIFPEDSGAPLLGLVPGVEKIINNSDISITVSQLAGDGAMVADIFRAIAPVAKSIYITTYSQIAKCFGVYIVAGSIFLPDDNGKVYNQCYVFGPEGEIAGIQKKLHLFQMESGWGLYPGFEYEIFKTEFGRIGIPICMDVTYFEICRMLASEGVELLIMPAANPEVYRQWEQLRGLWARVQENYLFGVQCCMVGDFAGLQLRGHTSFYAPIDMTNDRSGILKTSDTPDKEEVVVYSLDYSKLRRLKEKQNPFAKLNYELFRRSLLEAYDIYLKKSAGGRSVI